MKCVYGFPFDTRRRLRTEFLIVSHYCANQLFLFSLSRSPLLLLLLHAEEIIKYFIFDNCKHFFSFFQLIHLSSLRVTSLQQCYCTVLTFCVGQSHRHRFIQIRWQCFYVNNKVSNKQERNHVSFSSNVCGVDDSDDDVKKTKHKAKHMRVRIIANDTKRHESKEDKRWKNNRRLSIKKMILCSTMRCFNKSTCVNN